jgi:O-antigen/teichoic acid export membrane protein
MHFVLHVRLESRRLERGLLREVASYSAFVFVGIVVDQLFWRTGHVLLGAIRGTASVAVFAIATQVAHYYMAFPLSVASVFLPRVTAMVVAGATSGELGALFARTARIQLVVLCYVLGGFGLFGREFINVWAGPEYDSAWHIALVVMVPLTVPLSQTLGLYVLQAKNMHRFRALLYLVVAAVNVLVSVFLVRRWGPIGAALGMAGTLVVGHVAVMNVYYHRTLRLDVPRFIRTVAGLLPAAVAAVAAGSLLTLVPGYSWPKLVGRVAVFTGLYAGAMLWFGLNAYERSLLGGAFGWTRRLRAGSASEIPVAGTGASRR